MKRRLVLSSIIVGLFFWCATISMHGQETCREVIPGSWITYNGSEAHNPEESDTAYVFPSENGRDLESVSYLAKDFLNADNALSHKSDVTYHLPMWCLPKTGKQSTSFAIKMEITGSKAVLTVGWSTLKVIRSLSWEDFRELQGNFEGWLLEQADPGSLCCIFQCSKAQFGKSYESDLLAFWKKVGVNVADYAAIPRWSPNKRRTGTSQNGHIDHNDYGAQMGAIPLIPGMRLQIHWGGVASYAFDSANVPITRQTVTGTSLINVVCRFKRITLVALSFLGDSPSSEEMNRSGPWTTDSVSPITGSAPDDSTTTAAMPFGISNNGALLGRNIVPVYNELDLAHIDALTAPNRSQASPKAPFLTLLLPREYTKADLALARQDTSPYTEIGPQNSTLNTSDAVANSDNQEDNLIGSLSRHYIIWGTNKPFTNPKEDVKELRNVSQSQSTPSVNFPFGALVFGNQTTISIDIPITVNMNAPIYVPLGETWGDVLDINAPWNEASRSECMEFTIRRTYINVQNMRDGTGQAYRSDCFKLRGNTISGLHQIEVWPGDNITFKQ